MVHGVRLHFYSNMERYEGDILIKVPRLLQDQGLKGGSILNDTKGG